MMGDTIRSFRWRAGRTLAMYLMEKAPGDRPRDRSRGADPAFADPGRRGLCAEARKGGREAALQYATPVSKYRFGGRIFMEETQEARDEAAMLDFRVDAKAVEGRTIFLVDDSIVRGTNATRIVRAFRAAGAKKIYFGTLWPMVIDSCFQGINTPTQKELIGARFNGDIDEVQVELGVDALYYLPEDGLCRQRHQGRAGLHGLHQRQTGGQVRKLRHGPAPGRLNLAISKEPQITRIDADPPTRAEISEFGFRISDFVPPSLDNPARGIIDFVEYRASSIQHRASSIEYRVG